MSVHVSVNGGGGVKIRKKIKVRTFSHALFHKSTGLPSLDGSAGLRPDPSGCCPLRGEHCSNPPPHYFRCRLPVQGAAADLENLAQNAKICRISYYGPKIIFQLTKERNI